MKVLEHDVSLREPDVEQAVCQKSSPTAKMPSAETLAQLSPEDAQRLRRILGEPTEFLPHALFATSACEQKLIAKAASAVTSGRIATGAHAALVLAAADTPPGATKLDSERWLFLRFNLCRKRAAVLVQQYAGRRLTLAAARELLAWDAAAHQLRSQIVRENIALVLAMVKRTRIHGVDPADLVSEGNLALLRAANKFDCGRGYRFSTYACRAILKSFSRVATRTSRYRGRFPTEFDPALEKSQELTHRREEVEQDCVDNLRHILRQELANLSDVERTVIRARFALDDAAHDDNPRGRTLEQVGAMIGVTKERVRQIQNKALRKLRTYLNQAVLV